jgi:hypothetical protein
MLRLLPFTLLSLLFVASPVMALKAVTKVLAQPTAPLRITAYTAGYQEGSQYRSEGIRHSVEYMSASDREIVAVQIGLVSFDVWNEFLDRTAGVDISNLQPSALGKGTWIARAFADFSFHTGVAYVGKVRFADGTLWAADLVAIGEELKNIAKDFDIAKLTEKPDKK